MSKIEVDLDAYVLPSDHSVWKATAGKTHRFYRAVRDANAIFPDVRGLELLSGEPESWRDSEILKIIAEDRWAREQDKGAANSSPSDTIKVSKHDRGVLTFLKRLWFQAKRGDIVVVPAEGWRAPLLIGEVLSDPGELQRIVAKDGEHTGTYFGRPVAWRASVAKQEITPELLKVVHTRTAVFSVAESVKEEVYRFAFGNFVYRGAFIAEFETSKERFTAEDSAVVGIWLNAMDVLRNSLAANDAREGKSVAELGLEKLPDDLAAELKIDIQSPGEIFVRTAGPFALSLMALFALGGCSASELNKDEVTVHLKQVGSGDTGAEKEVNASVNAIKRALGENRIEDANKLIQRSKDDAQLRARASLKRHGGKGK